MPLGNGDTNVFSRLNDSDTRSKSSSELLNIGTYFAAKLEVQNISQSRETIN